MMVRGKRVDKEVGKGGGSKNGDICNSVNHKHKIEKMIKINTYY